MTDQVTETTKNQTWSLECDHCGGAAVTVARSQLVSEGDADRCDECGIAGHISIAEPEASDGDEGEDEAEDPPGVADFVVTGGACRKLDCEDCVALLLATPFLECDSCGAKPGTPALCAGCLVHRHLLSRAQAVVSKLMSEREALREQRDRALHGREMIAIELTEAIKEKDVAKSNVKVARSHRDDVWFWEEHGNDLESFSDDCPIVMKAETLRVIEEEKMQLQLVIAQQKKEMEVRTTALGIPGMSAAQFQALRTTVRNRLGWDGTMPTGGEDDPYGAMSSLELVVLSRELLTKPPEGRGFLEWDVIVRDLGNEVASIVAAGQAIIESLPECYWLDCTHKGTKEVESGNRVFFACDGHCDAVEHENVMWRASVEAFERTIAAGMPDLQQERGARGHLRLV